ncbi:MAG: hypothetical protein HC888_01730 [Candidatus Competibacteraceae bacterium]|nr:hypothetical protein [Candidatus Competibacteraceae bacterium]
MTFNAKKFAETVKFACARCGKETAYNAAANGCSFCSHHIFHVAYRGNIQDATNPDGQKNPFFGDDYPYLRQNQRAKDVGSGRGDKLTTPGQDGGFGTNDREGYPDIPSQFPKDEQSENSKQPKLPSEETLVETGPSDGYEVHGKFTNPGDVFSPGEEFNRDNDGWDEGTGYDKSNKGGTMETNLRQQRVSPTSDDNIFEFTRRKQKGIRR